MAWGSNVGVVVSDAKADWFSRFSGAVEVRVSGGNLSNLEEEFSRARQEFAPPAEMQFCLIVEGTARSLHSAISDEIYLIGHEALSNAFRHSRARDVEVELEYGASHLRLLVRDNGCGIDPEVLSSGRFRHVGLSDMKERAARIGARLRVLSHGAAGTEVELTVPASVAYKVRSDERSSRWLASLFS
jgi:signal transduction histidine kinase